MRNRAKSWGSAVAAGAALALLAGCGGDSDEETTKQTPDQGSSELPEPISGAGAESVKLEDRLVTELRLSEGTGDGPDWMVSAFDSLWVKLDSGGVVRIDPATGKVIAEIGGSDEPVQSACQGIGASDDVVWSCPREGSIERIDPAANSVAETIRLKKLPDQGRLVSAAGYLWLLGPTGKQLTGIDLTTGKSGAEIPLPIVCADLAADGTTLWLTCPQEDSLLKVDAEAKDVAGNLELPGATNVAVADDVWVGFDEGIAQVDPDSSVPGAPEVVAVYEVYPQFQGSLFATPDAVWAREADGHFLTRIDPKAQEITHTIEAPKLPSGGDVVVIGDTVWATAFDDGTLVGLRGP